MIPEPPAPVTGLLAALPRPVCAYVHDTARLAANATAVSKALHGASVLYAVKANGHPDVVATLARHLDGLEVASGGELALALRAGAGRIAIGGPAKTDAALTAALGAARSDVDITVNVESAGEIRRLAYLAGPASGAGSPAPLRVALRVNRAGVRLSGSHRMTGVPTPFGIDETRLDRAAALAASARALDVTGFHLHAVSNSMDAGAYADFVDDSVRWSRAAAGRLGIDLREINVGGGFGVDYTGPDRFDVDALGAAMPALPDGVRLTVEPGRYLAADAGWYAAEVIDLKHTHGRWFAVLRGGTHHFRLPAAWGYSHPFHVLPRPDWPYPFDRPEVRDVEVDAVGELCTPRDVLTRGARVERLRVGDVLVFGNTGAYGWDISHHEFLRHDHPSVHVL